MPECLRAAFYRGGTSMAVVFNGADLPDDRALRDRIFLHVLGRPDAYGRQLNGMGGGLLSLSKVVIVQPSARDDADADYNFVQIAVAEPLADYGSACGNMSSCVGPFAVDEGMVAVTNDQTEALVRIFDTNTKRIFQTRFQVRNGKAVEEGHFSIPGVSGAGSKVALDFLAPGGAATGKLLPTGNAVDVLEVDGIGALEVSLVDAANPVVFFRASDLDRTATERPQDLDADTDFMAQVEKIRCAGAVAMGLAKAPGDVARSNPKIAMLGEARAFEASDGSHHAVERHDLNVRLVSMGNSHRAITLTGGMCTAVAAQIPGTLIAQMASPQDQSLQIGNSSGVLPTTAEVSNDASGPLARSASTFRTQRRIMEGAVLYPSSILEVTK